MTLADVKRCLLKRVSLKYLSILEAREIILNNADLFEENWNILIFIQELFGTQYRNSFFLHMYIRLTK